MTREGYKVLFDHYNYDVDVFREDILTPGNSQNMVRTQKKFFYLAITKLFQFFIQ